MDNLMEVTSWLGMSRPLEARSSRGSPVFALEPDKSGATGYSEQMEPAGSAVEKVTRERQAQLCYCLPKPDVSHYSHDSQGSPGCC